MGPLNEDYPLKPAGATSRYTTKGNDYCRLQICQKQRVHQEGVGLSEPFLHLWLVVDVYTKILVHLSVPGGIAISEFTREHTGRKVLSSPRTPALCRPVESVSWSFCWFDQPHGHKKHGRKGLISSYMLNLIILGSQGRTSLRQEVTRDYGGVLLPDLFLIVCSACFLHRPEPPALE